ncbi:MAG: hypothetical protein ACXWVJ_07725, partial [Caulobacteraceae bacterium]
MSQYAATINVTALDGTNGFKIGGLGTGDVLYKVSSGDINADGFTDLIVGASGVGSDEGAAYVVFGADNLGSSFNLAGLNGANGFVLDGLPADNQLGFSVGAADINHDGFQDVLVGAFNKAAYVVFGKASGFAASPDLTTLDGSDGFKIYAPAAVSGI